MASEPPTGSNGRATPNCPALFLEKKGTAQAAASRKIKMHSTIMSAMFGTLLVYGFLCPGGGPCHVVALHGARTRGSSKRVWPYIRSKTLSITFVLSPRFIDESSPVTRATASVEISRAG